MIRRNFFRSCVGVLLGALGLSAGRVRAKKMPADPTVFRDPAVTKHGCRAWYRGVQGDAALEAWAKDVQSGQLNDDGEWLATELTGDSTSLVAHLSGIYARGVTADSANAVNPSLQTTAEGSANA